MRRTTRAVVLTAGTVVFVFIGGGGTVTARNPRPAPEGVGPSLSGEALERATDAALAATGGGKVSGTEVGDEASYYEVEVDLDDGRQVEVELDADFAVVSTSENDEDDDAHGDDD